MQNIYGPTTPVVAAGQEYPMGMQYAPERQPYGLGLMSAARPTCVTPAPAYQGPVPLAQRTPSLLYTRVQQYHALMSQPPAPMPPPAPYYTSPAYSMVPGWGTPVPAAAPPAQMTPSPVQRPRSVALGVPLVGEYSYQSPTSYYYSQAPALAPGPAPAPIPQAVRTQSLPPIKLFSDYQAPASQNSSRVPSPMIPLRMRPQQRQADGAKNAPEFVHKGSRKRYHSSDGYNKRNSSIAGTIYNSTAVYKRLKPCTSSGAPAQESAAQTGLRPQGRPFSSNITGRFLVHHDLFSLFRYMNKKNLQVLACYDMRELAQGCAQAPKPDKDDEKKIEAKNEKCENERIDKNLISPRSSRSSASIFSADCASSISSHASAGGAQDALALACKFEDIHLGPFESAADFVPILDSFFSQKHCSLRVLNNGASGTKPDRARTPPKQRTILYKPSAGVGASASAGTGADADSDTEHSAQGSAQGSRRGSACSEKGNHPEGASEHSPHTLKFILNNSEARKVADKDVPEGEQKPGPNQEKPRRVSTNFHEQIVKAFGIEEYQFIKAIRDSNGHVLKLESIKPPRNSTGEIEYTAEWVKKTICYPRYKGGMKIHLTSASQSFVLYSDMKMLLWDVTQEDKLLGVSACVSASPASTLTSGLPPLGRETKERLFGGRLVFVKTDGS